MPAHHDHALVIGGTGMLRTVCLHLAQRCGTVSILARSISRLDDLAREARAMGGRVSPISVDYHDDAALLQGVRDAIQLHGPITLAVAWIHDSAPRALRIVAEQLAMSRIPCDLIDIRGSSSADPTLRMHEVSKSMADLSTLRHRVVVLGFVREGRSSRWLNNDEIAAGVIRAIESEDRSTIVGMVRPWSAHP